MANQWSRSLPVFFSQKEKLGGNVDRCVLATDGSRSVAFVPGFLLLCLRQEENLVRKSLKSSV